MDIKSAFVSRKRAFRFGTDKRHLPRVGAKSQ
jgi:hypothetical protein